MQESLAAMIRGLVRGCEMVEQDKARTDSSGALWDDSVREALVVARRLGWGNGHTGTLTDLELPDGEFELALEKLINRHCLENDSMTPDFILATYLQGCLAAFTQATKKRDRWWGHRPIIGTVSPGTTVVVDPTSP